VAVVVRSTFCVGGTKIQYNLMQPISMSTRISSRIDEDDNQMCQVRRSVLANHKTQGR
jgi:hypothetical protein